MRIHSTIHPSTTYYSLARTMPSTHPHHAALSAKLAQLAQPLHPLVQVTTARAHADFPRTLLHFWLLTATQLDDMAGFYHQREQCVWSALYPRPIVWPVDGASASLERKRCLFGRFIGLSGCEDVVEEVEVVEERGGQSLDVAAAASAAAEEDAEKRIWEKAERAREMDERGRKGMWC